MDTNTITIEKLKVYKIADSDLTIQLGSTGQIYIHCKDEAENLVIYPLDRNLVRISLE